MSTPSTYELLKPIADAIDRTLFIDNVTDNGDETSVLFACNTLWALSGFPITIDGIPYKIIAVNPNVSITVSGPFAPNKGSFQLYPPIFYHGTIKSTEEEVNKKINKALLSHDRTPMIWLHEPTDETRNEDTLKAIALTSRCELYFMVDADFSKWTNNDHYTYAIKPMRNLIEAFMVAVKLSGVVNYNLIKTSSPKDFARWGVYMSKDGGEKTIFSREMSGSKFEVEIPFIRTEKTCCV